MPPEAYQATVPAFVVAALALALAPRGGAPPGSAASKRRALSPAIATVAGYAAGHAGLDGWPRLPPSQAEGWLPWLALAFLAAAGLEAGILRLQPPRWFLRSLLGLATSFVTLQALVPGWASWEAASWVVGLGLSVTLVWSLSEAAARARDDPGVPLAWMLAAMGGSATLVAAHSAKLAFLAAALAATLGAAAVVTLFSPRSMSPAAGATSGVLIGLLMNGRFYADLTWASAILIALALVGPAAVWLLPGSMRTSRWTSVAVGLATSGILAAAAVALSPPSFDE